MPFANKFRFTLRIPEAGETLGGFVVESSSVKDEPQGDGRYEYPIEMVLAGPGGKQGLGRMVREEFAGFRTTFSAYGNAYQLRLGRFTVEGLGGRRYRVIATGLGTRIDLEKELRRFTTYAVERGKSADASLIDAYVEDYRKDVTRKNPELPY